MRFLPIKERENERGNNLFPLQTCILAFRCVSDLCWWSIKSLSLGKGQLTSSANKVSIRIAKTCQRIARREHSHCFEKQVGWLDRTRTGQTDWCRTAFSLCPDDCSLGDVWRRKWVFHGSDHRLSTSIVDEYEPRPHGHPKKINSDRMSNGEETSFGSLRRNLGSKPLNNCHRRVVICTWIGILCRGSSSLQGPTSSGCCPVGAERISLDWLSSW